MTEREILFNGARGPEILRIPAWVEPFEIRPAQVEPLADPAGTLLAHLEQWEKAFPSGGLPLKPGASTALVVSDAFRKTGVHLYLPELLDWLEARGIPSGRVHALFASGAHRPPTREEAQTILGDRAWRRLASRLIFHDPEDYGSMVFTGTTSRGTPVWINRYLVESENVILTGAVVPHYFAGFGGGPKSIVPGLAGLETIAANHSLTLDPGEDRVNPAVRIGVIQGNPVAEDIREAAAAVPVSLLVNAVMTPDGRAVACLFAGDAAATHAAACDWIRGHYMPEITSRADIVVASAGHAANFLQSHKALYNAWQACVSDGMVVLDAPCPEGLGGVRFDRWLALGSVSEVARHLRGSPEINGQTALSTLSRAPRTILVSGLDDETGRLLRMERADTVTAGVCRAVERLRREGRSGPLSMALMAEASCCVPKPVESIHR
ncbi:MAG TPA: nickel-dependent lactate racemase [Candidatus Hydrogenedentes bacterium]|nr:nickel-dependent lactate racemase [Candidatus Hydrogenedentota bacterium]